MILKVCCCFTALHKKAGQIEQIMEVDFIERNHN